MIRDKCSSRRSKRSISVPNPSHSSHVRLHTSMPRQSLVNGRDDHSSMKDVCSLFSWRLLLHTLRFILLDIERIIMCRGPVRNCLVSVTLLCVAIYSCPPPSSTARPRRLVPSACCWLARAARANDASPWHRSAARCSGIALFQPAGWLVLRRSLTDGELKTYLCNAPPDVPQQRLSRTSGMRWPIESCFEVSKQELGMGDYEVRPWRGWQHHMTLVIVALAFLVRLTGRFEKRSGPKTGAGAVPGGARHPTPLVRCALGAGSFGVLANCESSSVLLTSETPADTLEPARIKSRCSIRSLSSPAARCPSGVAGLSGNPGRAGGDRDRECSTV